MRASSVKRRGDEPRRNGHKGDSGQMVPKVTAGGEPQTRPPASTTASSFNPTIRVPSTISTPRAMSLRSA
jgi:hypothetical protein